MSSATSLNQAFSQWKNHSSKPRLDTELTVSEFIRDAHPGFHVTRTPSSQCALLGYARAGFAIAIQDSDTAYEANRKFDLPRRLQKEDAKLSDEPTFGRWRYKWNDIDYVVYLVAYADRYYRVVMNFFILSPYYDDAVQDCHHADTDALLLACGLWTKEVHDEIEIFDDQRWQKSKELYQSVQGASWDDVILDPTMKANLIQDVQNFFDNRDVYKQFNVPWKRGVILHGVPGNGKTLSIKALINSLAARPEPVPSLYVKSLDACQGPKWSMKTIFEHARKMAPCLLIFEDLDSMVEDKTRSYFLNEVDGLDSNEGILMIGSTNHLARLDSAITKRPSRFDRKYHFKLPAEAERVAYTRLWARKFSGSTQLDFPEALCEYIAKITDGFSFAYLQELFVACLLELARGTTGADTDMADEQAEEDAESNGDNSSDTVVVEKAEDAAEEGGDEKAQASTKEQEKAQAPKPKRSVAPLPEIPDELQDNLLCKVVRVQAKNLLLEMDNSDQESDAAKNACAPGGGGALAAAAALFAPRPAATAIF